MCVLIELLQLAPPPPRLTKYEEKRIARIQENEKKMEEFGIKKKVGELKGTESDDTSEV